MLNRQVGFIIMVALGCLFTQSCAFFCADEPTLPPHDLVEMSDHVIIGRLVAIDTLADLGNIQYEGEVAHVWVVQFAYRVEELVKGSRSDSLIYLWYCPTHNYRYSWVNTPEFEIDRMELVYGDSITGWDDIPKVIYSISGADPKNLASCLDVDQTQSDSAGFPRWHFEERDCTILRRMSESADLRDALDSSLRLGRVIAASEKYYWTHNAFNDGSMAYCARDPLFDIVWYHQVSSNGYLDELRHWTQVDQE